MTATAITTGGTNQRGELTSPEFATVMLPSRDIGTKLRLDYTVVDLDPLPIR